jgi:hypothetical protein
MQRLRRMYASTSSVYYPRIGRGKARRVDVPVCLAAPGNLLA